MVSSCRTERDGLPVRKSDWDLGDARKFVIELLSPIDRPRLTRAKMDEWIENGAQLGWMIDCSNKTVAVYRVGWQPEEVVNASSIAVAGFVLDLEALCLPCRG